MNISVTERRQIENEMIFRRVNEKVGDAINKLDAELIEDGKPELMSNGDFLLHFRCECSDEECDARIPIKLSDYQEIHKNRDAFIIKLKHQVDEIEKIILTRDTYSVVEKNNSISEPGDKLNVTAVSNT